MLRTVTVATLFAVPALALIACDAPEQVATQPGTTPSIWTGSPPPAAPAEGEGEGGPASEALSAQLKNASGITVATADFEFFSGYAAVTVRTTAGGQLTPGFHGLHVHAVGKCEAGSVAPTGGEPGDFNSAGAHFQVPGHSGHPASGDLTSLQVREDGTAELVTTTDAFTAEDLLAGAKTSSASGQRCGHGHGHGDRVVDGRRISRVANPRRVRSEIIELGENAR